MCQQEMTSVTVVQVDVEKADKKKHLNNWNVKKNDKKEILTMKNNENNEYSKAAEIVDEKKSQILRHSISYHADDHVTEKSDHYDDEHESEQEHVVHVADIMFDKTDNDNCLTSVVKRWHEELMWQSENQVCEVKQLKITWVSVDDVDDTENDDQQELQELHQSTTDNEKTESDNDE